MKINEERNGLVDQWANRPLVYIVQPTVLFWDAIFQKTLFGLDCQPSMCLDSQAYTVAMCF